MIIATPKGEYFSVVARSDDEYRVRLRKITEKYASHLCLNSEDYIVYRSLTLREHLRILRLRLKKVL